MFGHHLATNMPQKDEDEEDVSHLCIRDNDARSYGAVIPVKAGNAYGCGVPASLVGKGLYLGRERSLAEIGLLLIQTA